MRIALKLLASLAALVMVLIVVVLVRSKRTFDAPYPDIHASFDPQVIERGRYIAYGAGHCVNCHTSNKELKDVEAGKQPPMAGGHVFEIPPGTFYTPNLTPDRETGIGRYSDQELARVIRYGVMPDNRAAIPFMEFHDLSDEDLVALISYLRSQPAIRRAVPPHRLNFLGKAVMAFLIKPAGPSHPVIRNSPPMGATLARGQYLATSVATCAECHTRRNEVDGSYVAPKFSGGGTMDIPGDREHLLVTPNLTPSRTGRITDWDEERFVGRFNAGVGIQGTHMPWRQFASMSDADKRAIYRYLRTLPPTENETGPSVQSKKEIAQRARQKSIALATPETTLDWSKVYNGNAKHSNEERVASRQ